MHRKTIIILALAAFGIIAFGVIFIAAPGRSTPAASLEVSYINVGQGDSILIHDSTGFDILIDGGKTSAGPTVLAYLRGKAIDDIDVMVASHADSDHIGGLIDVLNATDIPVQQVIYNGYPGDTANWKTFATAVANEGLTLIPAQFPQELTWGEVKIYILNPASGLVNPETNDASVVFRMDYGGVRFLFPGDIDSTIEATVVARGTPIAAQILKVAHHGSQYSSSAAFLAAVQPLEAVISVGTNSYGHPSADTIARLQAIGARVLRTDKLGTIVITSDGITYVVDPTPPPLFIYMPLIVKPDLATPTQTQTVTATATQTQIPNTPTATSTTQSPATTGNVVITSIFYDGTGSSEPDEYVVIQNNDTRSIQLQGWTLRDSANHIYTFPNYIMTSGQVCRVYTNEYHPEWCGFNYGSGAAIWNNTGDCAYLRDALSNPTDDYCY